jgi:hypothetical protein
VTFQPKPGFDWNRVGWGHPDSPRSELCSYCFAAIGEDEVPLILAAQDGRVAQFCDDCMSKWWGMTSFKDGCR